MKGSHWVLWLSLLGPKVLWHGYRLACQLCHPPSMTLFDRTSGRNFVPWGPMLWLPPFSCRCDPRSGNRPGRSLLSDLKSKCWTRGCLLHIKKGSETSIAQNKYQDRRDWSRANIKDSHASLLWVIWIWIWKRICHTYKTPSNVFPFC